MPVSTSVHISHCLRWIISLNPKSVLDVGCGFGLWGFLCREYLDVMSGRVYPHEWQVRIDGIEFFEPYIQDHQRALYSSIRIGDIRDAASDLEPYDLIVAGDVIEHLDKPDGERVLDQLYDKAKRALLVNIPIGEGWDHPEQHGNPGELHRSMWRPEDFDRRPHFPEFFELPNGRYGVFFCPKGGAAQMNALLQTALEHYERDAIGDKERLFEQMLALEPGHTGAAAFLVNAYVERGDIDRAVDLLERTLEAAPGYHYGYIALAQLLRARGSTQQANAHLQRLLSLDGVPGPVAAEARQLLDT